MLHAARLLPKHAAYYGAGGTVLAACFEAIDHNIEARSLSIPEVAASAGTAASAGLLSMLSAQTVLSKHAVRDALYARHWDASSVLRRAGGRIGARAMLYMCSLKALTSGLTECLKDWDVPSFLLVWPSIPLIAALWLPAWIPLMLPAYAGGSILGAVLGRRLVADIVARGGHGEAAAIALRTAGLSGGAWPPLMRFQLTVGAFLLALPSAFLMPSIYDFSGGSGGGNGGGGGDGGGGSGSYSWKWERKWELGGGEQFGAPSGRREWEEREEFKDEGERRDGDDHGDGDGDGPDPGGAVEV
jgi:hypothetical protein